MDNDNPLDQEIVNHISCDSIEIINFREIVHEKNSFNFIHLNINGCATNHNSFLAFLSACKVKYDVIALTETKVYSNNDVAYAIDGYDCLSTYRDTQNDLGWGLKLYITKSLRFSELKNLTLANDSFESLFVKITLKKNTSFYFGVIYRMHATNITTFNECFESQILNKLPRNEKIYITGDFNIDLNNTEDNTVKAFVDVMQNKMFLPCITSPTRVNMAHGIATRYTLIDHTWSNCSLPISSLVIHVNISDHYPISSSVSIPDAKNLIKISFRDFSQENVNKLENQLPQLLGTLCMAHDQNPNFATNSFLSLLNDILTNFFPIKHKQIGIRRIMSPWINQEIRGYLNRKHQIYKMYKNGRVTLNYYNGYKNLLTEGLRLAKQVYYEKSFENSKSDIKKSWKIIKSLLSPSSKTTNTEFVINNTIVSNPKEIANHFGQHFQQATETLLRETQNPQSSNINFDSIPRIENSANFHPTTTGEIEKIIKYLPNKTSTNEEFPIFLLKLFSVSFSTHISYLVNLSLAQGIYPDILKIARVVPIHKKDDIKTITNYRPISVLKNLNKIFEKVIYSRIDSFAYTNNLIPKEQYGFRKNKSTKDAALDFVLNITSAYTENKYGIAIFADFSKAFDTICHERLLFKLEKLGFRGSTNKLLSSYLKDRKQYINILGETSDQFTIHHGVPQGSNLGPILFNLYVSDLPNFVQILHTIQFADDTSFLTTGKDLGSQQTVQSEVNIFSQWAYQNNLSLNVSKTKVVIFTNKQDNLQWNITINNTDLELVKNYKFLGTIIDDRLSYAENLKTLHSKVSRLAGVTYKMGPFLNESSARSLYFAIVHSRLSYAICIWGGAAATHIKPLQTCQNNIIRNLFRHKFPLLSTTELYNKQSILKIEDMYKLELGLVMFKAINTENSYEILANHIQEAGRTHQYGTRRPDHLRLPRTRVNADHKGFLFQAFQHWNKIPLEIKASISVNVFKKSYKSFLLRNYNL